MKSSVHLFYGIIIGILAMFCVGQKQADKKEFAVEELDWSSISGRNPGHAHMVKLKKQGWTIIDWEIDHSDNTHVFHIGK